MDYENLIKKAKSIAEIFEIVKTIVSKYLNVEQHGLLVGLSDLGSYNNGFLGAYYSLNSNMIVINKSPLFRLKQTNPTIFNYYVFHVLLHEYIHSIGLYDEAQTRQLVFEISNHFFGANHTITQLASNIEKFIPNLMFPAQGRQEPEYINIEFILGIDRRNTGYIG